MNLIFTQFLLFIQFSNPPNKNVVQGVHRTMKQISEMLVWPPWQISRSSRPTPVFTRFEKAQWTTLPHSRHRTEHFVCRRCMSYVTQQTLFHTKAAGETIPIWNYFIWCGCGQSFHTSPTDDNNGPCFCTAMQYVCPHTRSSHGHPVK